MIAVTAIQTNHFNNPPNHSTSRNNFGNSSHGLFLPTIDDVETLEASGLRPSPDLANGDLQGTVGVSKHNRRHE